MCSFEQISAFKMYSLSFLGRETRNIDGSSCTTFFFFIQSKAFKEACFSLRVKKQKQKKKQVNYEIKFKIRN